MSGSTAIANPGEHPIFVAECGNDFEVHVVFGQLGVRIAALDHEGCSCGLPHFSSDQARDLAARLLYAADQLDTL